MKLKLLFLKELKSLSVTCLEHGLLYYILIIKDLTAVDFLKFRLDWKIIGIIVNQFLPLRM
jgi:hypothetical protein